jgi:hypothetical protein
MLRGRDCPPLDHRGSFHAKMFGWYAPLNVAAQTAKNTASNCVIYDEVKPALAAGAPGNECSTLGDEHFGAAILRDAAREGVKTAYSAQESARNEFEFEYAQDFSIPLLLDVRGGHRARLSSARSRNVTANS